MAGTKRYLIFFAVLVGLYVTIMVPFLRYMKEKPVVEKLGALPTITTMKFLAADQKPFVGSSIIMKVIIYFGGLIELSKSKIIIPPDYPAMSRAIHAAVKLDPYNMDAYYFAQAFLTWDVKQFQVANDLLEEGMRYRNWDWSLPFFIGFNYSYFLKNTKCAAVYYKKAAELSGQELHANLAGRFMQESGETDLAIAYLETMVKGARNPMAKKSFTTRLIAFERAKQIESAIILFKSRCGRLPATVNELVEVGQLSAVPIDPYGGEYYITPKGRVTTTSNFAFKPTKEGQQGRGVTRQ